MSWNYIKLYQRPEGFTISADFDKFSTVPRIGYENVSLVRRVFRES